MVRVSGWSGPSLAIWASRTRSSRAIASGSLPAARYASGEVVERGQGVGVVGAELGDPGVADPLEQGDRLGELAGGLVRRRRGCRALSGCRGGRGRAWRSRASRTRSKRAIASWSLPAAWYAKARLLSVVRVSGWSGPSLAISASRTRSNRAIASGSLPAAWYAMARLLSVARVSGWSGPSLAIWASRTRS